jgi:DNA-directed RNA polymerase subunit RPC12/RpoP
LPNPTDEPEPADHFLVREEEEDGDGVDDNIFCEEVKSESDQEVVVDDKGAEVIIETLDGLDTTPPPPSLVASESLQLRGMEDRLIGGEILFERVSKPAYFNWDNLRWLSYSGARKVAFCQMGYRYFASQEKKLMFWSATTTDTCYEARSLVIYNEPSLILILRRPKSEAEVFELLGLDDLSELDEPDSCLETHWVVESVVEPSTCTLRLSPLTNVCSIPPTDADERRLSCLELRTPVESILFSSVRVRETVKPAERSFGDSGAFLEASATEAALMKKICSSHDQRKELGLMGADLSWKHQVILGTLHSLVVSGSAKLLDTALQNAMIRAQADTDGFADVSRLPSRVIDEPDESGLTPLYYAVMKKMSDAVALLIKAGASSDFRDAHNGMTLAHLAARNGDEKSLATILECNAPRPNPNALDATGRTPMYVACVEGQESTSLRKCITVLAAWGGKLTIPDSLVPLLSPVHYLASIWRAEPLAVVLEHTGYRYPLRSLASSEDEHVSASVGALFQYPLHAAIAALSLDATGSSGELLGTLRVLVERGFEVNERMDRMSSTPAVFKDLVGFTPLQILTVASIRLTESAESVDALALTRIRKLIEDVAIFLVRNGARISMDPPPVCRPRRILSVVVEATDNRHIRNCITWTSKEMVKALGDDVTFKQAAQEWHDSKTVKANDSFDLLENDEEVFPDNDAGGGSDEKSCAVCWKQFGAVMNWKHRCRVTRRFVCDECSSKRLVRGTKQYRACDGQYRLARFDAANEYQQAVSSYNSRSAPAQQSGEDQVATRLERLAASEQSERDSLFGNMLGQATGLIFGSEIQDDVEPDSLGGLSSALSGARDALNQRGDKLNQLGDKSADLVNASESFAKMAKELAKKSEQGFFW